MSSLEQWVVSRNLKEELKREVDLTTLDMQSGMAELRMPQISALTFAQDGTKICQPVTCQASLFLKELTCEVLFLSQKNVVER